MLRLNDIVEKINSYLYVPEKEIELLRRAYVYSAQVHKDQKRSSGEPYLSHPLEVSGILADMKLDLSSIATGLLHDTVEDTLAKPEDIESLFGKEIAFLVDGVTKISQLPVASRADEQAESFRKLILATAKDIRVVLIKLADRLHNMRTLEYLSEERRRRIAKETQEIYAPLAHRLGIFWIGTELEDLSFRFLNPEEYQSLSNVMAKKKKDWERYVDEVKVMLGRQLEEFGVNAEITGRFKHIYGIYKKMQSQGVELDKVYDVLAFRIITNSLKDCYDVLGAVHSAWKPVPGRFRDFIALPKVNGYQSLHTTVIGPFGERMEIQIRTREMHRVAEYGIAAHWKYKEGKIEREENYKVYASLRQLLEWKDIKDPTEFLEAIKGELIADMVYVFTPKGDLKELPNGATPVDFAYAIHTDIGNRCMRAMANGKLVPLDYRLRSGATVEIVTAPDKQPSRDWLQFVATSRAKTKIRTWLRTEEREQSRVVGKSISERKFKQHGLDFQKMLKNGELEEAFQEFKFKDAEEFYLGVAFGKVSVSGLLKAVLPKETLELPPEKESRLEKIIQTFTRATSGVLVKGYNNVMIKFGNCCTPLPGEGITGYITRGRGITVHKHDCSQLLDIDPARKIDVEWDRHFNGQRPTKIAVVCSDRPGMLSSITNSIALSKVNISKAEIHLTSDDKAVGTFEVSISDLAQLERLISAIKKVKGVISVERVAGA